MTGAALRSKKFHSLCKRYIRCHTISVADTCYETEIKTSAGCPSMPLGAVLHQISLARHSAGPGRPPSPGALLVSDL